MKVKIIKPTGIAATFEAYSVSAEGREGSFTMKERHIDYVSVLRAGILTADTDSGERFFAVDGGVLVKAGAEVRVSSPRIIESGSLEELESEIIKSEAEETELEKKNRSMVTGLEAALMTGFVDI